MNDRIERWLVLKAQELQIRRELEQLQDVAELLLIDRSYDERAAELGIELTRPRADVYFYGRDPRLAAAQAQLQCCRTQVLELQQHFRNDCREGRRAIDVDYEPACRLTVQLRHST